MRIVNILLAAFLVLITALLIGTGVYVWHKPEFMPIQQVQIQGQDRFVPKSAIVDALLPVVNKGFFHAPVQQAQQALATLPGVDQATVRLVWPNIVQATLTELQAMAQWPNGRLVSNTGVVFKPLVTNAGADLPVFIADDTYSTDLTTMYPKLMAILQPAGLSIKTLIYHPVGGWRLQTQQGFWVFLGVFHPLHRLAIFTAAYPQLIAQNHWRSIGYVDMRYQTGFALHWSDKKK